MEAALIGYQHQYASVAAKIAELQKRLGVRKRTGVVAARTDGRRPRKHRISAEGRARIAAAQKKRWAAAKKAPA